MSLNSGAPQQQQQAIAQTAAIAHLTAATATIVHLTSHTTAAAKGEQIANIHLDMLGAPWSANNEFLSKVSVLRDKGLVSARCRVRMP